jgi:hypothetical protein
MSVVYREQGLEWDAIRCSTTEGSGLTRNIILARDKHSSLFYPMSATEEKFYNIGTWQHLPHPTPLTEALEAAAPLFYNYYDYELWTDTHSAQLYFAGSLVLIKERGGFYVRLLHMDILFKLNLLGAI